jgi:heptosyltransferase-2
MDSTFLKSATPRSILVVDLAFIGDLLMTTPALACLRKAFPDATIDLLVSPGSRDVVERNPDVNRVLLTEMKHGGLGAIRKEAKRIGSGGYDLAVCFHRGHGTLAMLKMSGIPRRAGFTNGGRGIFLSGGVPFLLQRHRAWNNLRLLEKTLGIEVDYSTPTRFDIETSVTEKILERFPLLAESDRLVAINPNAAWPTKRWIPEGFAEVGNELVSRGFRIVLVGGPKEKHIAGQVKGSMKSSPIDLTGETTIQELGAVLAKSLCLVTNDSGPMHLGQAVGTKVVPIFGPTDPVRCGPWQGEIEPVQVQFDCIKCYKKTCWHHTCMVKITSKEVIERALACISLPAKS